MVGRTCTLTLIVLFIFNLSLSAQDSLIVKNLPLETLPAAGQDELILFLTGDGGWNSFSQELCQSFVKKGYSVVALNSRKYFWDVKTPDKFARDVTTLITYYLQTWKKKNCLIVGYSFGADVAAFLPNRLATTVLAKIRRLALLSPGASTDFEIKLSDLISSDDTYDRKYNVRNELEKSVIPILCIFGKEEELILKKALHPSTLLKVEELPGPHHYYHESDLLAKHILF